MLILLGKQNYKKQLLFTINTIHSYYKDIDPQTNTCHLITVTNYFVILLSMDYIYFKLKCQ